MYARLLNETMIAPEARVRNQIMNAPYIRVSVSTFGGRIQTAKISRTRVNIPNLFSFKCIYLAQYVMDVLLVGHSFIRRYRDQKLRRQRGERPTDISPTQIIKAQQMASAMRLSQHVRAVFTLSDNIVLMRHVLQQKRKIRQLQPEVVVFDIGSNDLAHLASVEPRRMLHMANELHSFISQLGLQLIIVNAILPRTAGISCTPETYAANAKLYNQYMSVFCEVNPKIVFNKQRGLQCLADTNNPRPVHQWSHDGIHLASSAVRTYENRLRHSILDNIYKE